MKKVSLLSGLLFVLFALQSYAQTDTISGFTFDDNTDMQFHPNFGLSGNLSYDIRAEDSTGGTRTISYAAGATTYAASAIDWDNGLENKFWSVKFKANGYTNLKVSSKQYSDASHPGPKYWKLQCRKSSGAWMDITTDTIVVANNWTTGVVNEAALPSSFDNPGSGSLYIRWVMASNADASGLDVVSSGISMIDDIYITGMSSVGVETVLFESNVSVYPNPSSGVFTIASAQEMESIMVYDIKGVKVADYQMNESLFTMDLSSLNAGLYIVNIQRKNEKGIITRKLNIQ